MSDAKLKPKEWVSGETNKPEVAPEAVQLPATINATVPTTVGPQGQQMVNTGGLPQQMNVMLNGVPQIVPIIYMPPNATPPMIVNGKPVNLAIAIPAQRFVDYRWGFWFSQLRMQFPTAVILSDNRYGIAASREALFMQFMSMPDLTHLLFVDTDVMLPDFSVHTLIQDTMNPDVHIVSGVYWNSLMTGDAAWIDDKPIDIKNFNANNRNVGNPLLEMDKIGFGCCLMTKEVGKRLLSVDRPYFYYKMGDAGPSHSEDFYFLSLCRRVGLKPYIDLRTKCNHMKDCIISAEGQVAF